VEADLDGERSSSSLRLPHTLTPVAREIGVEASRQQTQAIC
jgi:hypothetical protein